MIRNYQAMRGPMFDEDCGCHCSEDRATFQDALDEIAGILDGITATTITDTLLDEIRAEVDKR